MLYTLNEIWAKKPLRKKKKDNIKKKVFQRLDQGPLAVRDIRQSLS